MRQGNLAWPSLAKPGMSQIEGINADHRCSEFELAPDFLPPTRGENRIEGINADHRCSEFGVGSQFPANSLWRKTGGTGNWAQTPISRAMGERCHLNAAKGLLRFTTRRSSRQLPATASPWRRISQQAVWSALGAIVREKLACRPRGICADSYDC